MPVILGIIAIVLGLMALYILAIAAFLSIVPAIAAAVAFMASVRFWIDEKIGSDTSFKRSITLSVTDTNISWHFTPEDKSSMWPTMPLFLSTGAALLAMFLELPFIKPKFASSDSFYWYSATTIGFCAAAGGPALTALAFKERMYAFLTEQVLEQVAAKFQTQTSLLRNIASTERQIAEHYQTMGLQTEASAAEHCRDAVLQHATGDNQEASTELVKHLEGLERDLTNLRTCLDTLDDVRAVFERTKTSVIRNGSATLLSVLDRIHLGLHSDLLSQLFLDRRWSEVREVLEGMTDELEMVRDTAERREPRVKGDAGEANLHVPKSLDDAYRILNVNSGTKKAVIRKLFLALQQSWHPDLVSDESERKMRNAKVQQINVAWDLIDEGHTDR